MFFYVFWKIIEKNIKVYYYITKLNAMVKKPELKYKKEENEDDSS